MNTEKEQLNYQYTMREITTDKHNIELFDLPNQRQIRNTQVQSLLRSLRLKEHFDSMFVVNMLDGIKRIRIIDGGHRVTALKRYFEEAPETKVKISMVVYRNLTPTEEKAVYTKWNIGVKQSIDDFIQSYKDEIPEYESILKELPTSIYGSKNKMKLRHIFKAYFTSKQKIFNGDLHKTNMQWVEALKRIEYSDIESIKETMAILKDIFNPTDIIDFTRLSAFKSHIFIALFTLVHANKVTLGRNYIIKRMKTVLYRTSELETFKQHTRAGSIEVYNRCKLLLNDGVDHKFR